MVSTPDQILGNLGINAAATGQFFQQGNTGVTLDGTRGDKFRQDQGFHPVQTTHQFHRESNFAIQHVNLVAEERTIKGSYLGSCVPKRDIPDYIEMFETGTLPVDRLMSEKITLDEVNEGFDRLSAGETVRQLIIFE